MNAHAPTADDAQPVVTRGALRAAIYEMIQDALGVVADEIARPALLTQSQLAEQLQIHERTVFALRREGMPVVMIGDSPRYELAPCLAWLRARKAGAQ